MLPRYLVELPAGLERYPEPYCTLAAVREFVADPMRPKPQLLRRFGQALNKHLAGSEEPLPALMGLPSTSAGLRRVCRNAWLLAAHDRIGGDARDLRAAVVTFQKHPWPTWAAAEICPPLHPDHPRGSIELFYAFKACDGAPPDSPEWYRGFIESAKKFSEKIVLEDCWHAPNINNRSNR
jgi:hypothetical protein